MQHDYMGRHMYFYYLEWLFVYNQKQGWLVTNNHITVLLFLNNQNIKLKWLFTNNQN